MRRAFIPFAALPLVFVLAASGYAQKRKKQSLCPHATTQAELNECAAEEFRKADAELNRTYQQLLTVNKSDQRFIEKLKTAQRAWISFRDAQLEALYSATDPQSEYGSVFPMCYSLAKTELTVERTKHLKRMLNGVEGDVCNWNIH